jgi:membrane protease YdiL (CAAX protease family)
MTKRTFSSRIATLLWTGAVAMGVSMVAGGVWALLFTLNLKTTPAFPWAVVPMGILLWTAWRLLRANDAGRAYLRARRVDSKVFAWSLVAGGLAIAALAGCWILMYNLFPMRANTLPDNSHYPLFTMTLMAIMGSMVSPITEEAGFRGYFQVALEREFQPALAITLSSMLFAIPHGFTHGWLLPKLFVYFLGGGMLGTIAYLTKSILPGMAVHAAADFTFFTAVWPYDAARRVGADGWFWIHVAQAVVFTIAAIVCYRKLAQAARRQTVHPRIPASHRQLGSQAAVPLRCYLTPERDCQRRKREKCAERQLVAGRVLARDQNECDADDRAQNRTQH